VALQDGSQQICSNGGAFDELNNPQHVFGPPDFEGYRHEVLGTQDASRGRALARNLKFDGFRFSQRVTFEVARHRQELDRPAFD